MGTPISFEEALEYSVIKDLYLTYVQKPHPIKLVELGVVDLGKLLVARFLLKEVDTPHSWKIAAENVKIAKSFKKIQPPFPNSCFILDREEMGRDIRRIHLQLERVVIQPGSYDMNLVDTKV